jgi:eukaryotic-like serine/threonine-protein kinase
MGVLSLSQKAKGKRQKAKGRHFILFLLFTALLLSVHFSQALADWPQFRANPLLTGVAVTDPPAPSLKYWWDYKAGSEIESSAAIVNNVIYFGTAAGDLHAVELYTGKGKWKYRANADGIGESSPAVANGLVYIGDLTGGFHAVNAANGSKAWTFKTGAEIKSSPVVVGDRVLIGSYDGHLYCLNARSGALIWKLQTEGQIHATPGVANGVAYIAGCDEYFHGVRIADGKEVFKVAMGAQVGSSPAIAGTTAYFGTYANEVLSLNLTAKKLGWRYEHPQRQFPYLSSPALADGKVVIGGRDKMVHCLNAATGKELWSFTTRARVESSPAIVAGRVYVGSNDGRFYVLDLAKGTKLWEFTSGGAISASPVIEQGRVIVGSQDGKLYCFGAA